MVVSLCAGLVLASGDPIARAAAEQPPDDPDCGGPCGDDPGCALAAASCLLEQASYRQALEELKAAYGANPADGRLVRAMALAYLGMGNSSWAINRLLSHLDTRPGDAETRAWAAWLLMQEGDLVRAASLLADAPEVAPGPGMERMALLSAAVSDLQGDRETAGSSLRAVMARHAAVYPEDRALLDHLRIRIRGDPGEPLRARVHLWGGYTSNAIQSSPTDPGASIPTGGTAGSPLLGVDLVVRFEPWASRWLRPVAELRGKAQGQTTTLARDYSYANLGARAGMDVGDRGPRLRTTYSVELLAVHGGDAYLDPGPRWFMEAHRAELEFLPVPQVQLFGGGGRRIYRELPRTRAEFDGGVAMVLDLPGGWNLTGVATGRYHDARHDAFDAFGATGLLRVAVPLPRQAMIKVKAMVAGDRYPGSADYYLSLAPREDVLVKVQVGPWTPPHDGFRLGLSYGFSGRHSTIESYAYSDHRVLLELRWRDALDPFAPSTATPAEGHLALPHGLDAEEHSGLDRVQDLLRQEDSARRGSSCVD
jgi:tetratricopeptide (TPR) repeat protein